MKSGNPHRSVFSGFSLVEMMVVLAVFAIALAGILKTSSILENAKSNDVVAVASDLAEAIRVFRERYRVLPGDAPQSVVMTIDPSASVAAGGDTNGLINLQGEVDAAVDHLFLAGLVRARRANSATEAVALRRLTSRYGDVWIMNYGLARDGTPTSGSPCGAAIGERAAPPEPPPAPTHFAVFNRIPIDVARSIDIKFDDGIWDTGRIRASSAYGGDPAPPDIVACFAMPL